MNRLIHRTITEFLRDTYGEEFSRIIRDDRRNMVAPATPVTGFATAGLTLAAERLSKPLPDLYEDLGAWLTRIEPLRRLLRFSGRDFNDFLLRLDELPGRAHLVLSTLDVPPLQVDVVDGTFWLTLPRFEMGWQHILVGLLRGMADDYGALCLLSVQGAAIHVEICDNRFAEGRHFTLHGAAATGIVP
ncbi:heme NO-binding protein [Paracoccus liaowanqingii]|uniref:Heme NO-binding protein n=1 Tax=Paracoccus liaowanqingii TaxID=2560053 RepID=A0A4P7HJC6_9RHOB|nr:heme NO-binding protein [Paracoccus liaowanqingii]QBX34224.1 heme NO-binding protein [Paracoccus liaowanqingii]TGN52944.1 heme NO-binding protein [Paracoccus liaowanqingii]